MENRSSRARHSVLSIFALVCALTVFLSFIGVILAVIDLVSRKPDKRHLFSYLAIGIGGLFTIIMIAACFSGTTDATTDSTMPGASPTEMTRFMPTENPKSPVITSIETEKPTAESTEKATAKSTIVPTEKATAKPTIAATEKPTEPNTKTYVLNTHTKKFHTSGCSSIKDIKDENKAFFTGSREEVLNKGYSPCKRCNP